jgi:chromosome segregation ATPase
MRATPAARLAFCIGAALAAGAARADSAGEGRLREALRTTTAQLRSLEDERSRWKAGEASLQQELESLRTQLAAARRALARGGPAEAETKRRLDEQAAAAEGLKESLAQCQAATRDATEAARAREDERARLATQAASLAERAKACEAKNERLYRVGKDVIDWLSNLGFGAALAAREPFLGLKRVELENVAQDYEDRLLDQRVKP